MSTTISHAAGLRFQGNAPDSKVTSVAEARAGKAADGSAAPQGTTAAAVQRGDTISQIMAKHGLDWNNPAEREQFLEDNPQFADVKGGRNPDLIWEGEVVYVRTGRSGDPASGPGTPTNGTVATGRSNANGETKFQDYKDGKAQGAPYFAKERNGQPVNHDTVGTDGSSVRTGPDGKPLNGWSDTGTTRRVPNSADNARVMLTQHQYRNYRDGKPVGAPYWDAAATDGKPQDSTVIGPDGKELRTDNHGNPKNGPVYVGAGEDGKGRYRNYRDGHPAGSDYQAIVRDAGPANAYTLDANGKFIRTGPDGRPLNTDPGTPEGRTNAALVAYMQDEHGQTVDLPGWGARRPSPAEKEALRQAIQAEKAAGVSKQTLQARYGCDGEIDRLIDESYG